MRTEFKCNGCEVECLLSVKDGDYSPSCPFFGEAYRKSANLICEFKEVK